MPDTAYDHGVVDGSHRRLDDHSGAITSSTDDETTDAQSVVALIRRLQNGQTSSQCVSVDDRQRCVEHLTVEGYSLVETAEILGVTERTIARDRGAIRRANAVERDPASELGTRVEDAYTRVREAFERWIQLTAVDTTSVAIGQRLAELGDETEEGREG